SSGRGGGMTLLLERETELAGLDDAVRDARAGTGSVVVITGPLGIGKSELLLAAPERADGCHVLRAGAAMLEEDFAFGVVRQLFERVIAASDAAEELFA